MKSGKSALSRNFLLLPAVLAVFLAALPLYGNTKELDGNTLRIKRDPPDSPPPASDTLDDSVVPFTNADGSKMQMWTESSPPPMLPPQNSKPLFTPPENVTPPPVEPEEHSLRLHKRREKASQPSPEVVPNANGLLDLQSARLYMVSLINKDRAKKHLQPVELDETASRGGQPHTDEMAVFGYLSHWEMDGKLPPERYCMAGGCDYVAENASYGTEGRDVGQMRLADRPMFSKEWLEDRERTMVNERPPEDGHRKNILAPEHNRVGIALSQAFGPDGSSRTTLTQEFINHYGSYSELPLSASPTAVIPVSGRLSPGLSLQCINLCREQLPKPMSIQELQATRSYNSPDRIAAFYPHGTSDGPIQLRPSQLGEEFLCNIPLNVKGAANGLYTIQIWASERPDQEPFVVSARTIEVSRRR